METKKRIKEINKNKRNGKQRRMVSQEVEST
jgi:hypothetical protein